MQPKRCFHLEENKFRAECILTSIFCSSISFMLKCVFFYFSKPTRTKTINVNDTRASAHRSNHAEHGALSLTIEKLVNLLSY